MFVLEDTVHQVALLFLLICVRSNCADEIIIQTFRNVGSNGSVKNVILQQLNRTGKLQCCLRCIERSGCLRLGVLPQGKCLLLGEQIEETRNQSVIAEGGYVVYLYSSVTASTPPMYTASAGTSAASHPQARNNTISAASLTTSPSTTLPSPSHTTNPDATSTTTPPSTYTARLGDNVTASTTTGESTTNFFDPNDPYIESKYTVITQTGTEADSESECIVTLVIIGDNGLTERFTLDHDGREFQRGFNDTFIFERQPNLGKLAKMRLEVLPFGLQGGWLVIGVEVKRERVHKHYRHFQAYYSYLNKWFQSQELSLNMIWSLLSPTHYMDFKMTSDYFEKL